MNTFNTAGKTSEGTEIDGNNLVITLVVTALIRL